MAFAYFYILLLLQFYYYFYFTHFFFKESSLVYEPIYIAMYVHIMFQYCLIDPMT